MLDTKARNAAITKGQRELRLMRRLQGEQLRIRLMLQKAIVALIKEGLSLEVLDEVRVHLAEIDSFISTATTAMIKVQDRVESSYQAMTDQALADQFRAEVQRLVASMSDDEWNELVEMRKA